jgi:hypothetical protein
VNEKIEDSLEWKSLLPLIKVIIKWEEKGFWPNGWGEIKRSQEAGRFAFAIGSHVLLFEGEDGKQVLSIYVGESLCGLTKFMWADYRFPHDFTPVEHSLLVKINKKVDFAFSGIEDVLREEGWYISLRDLAKKVQQANHELDLFIAGKNNPKLNRLSAIIHTEATK